MGVQRVKYYLTPFRRLNPGRPNGRLGIGRTQRECTILFQRPPPHEIRPCDIRPHQRVSWSGGLPKDDYEFISSMRDSLRFSASALLPPHRLFIGLCHVLRRRRRCATCLMSVSPTRHLSCVGGAVAPPASASSAACNDRKPKPATTRG